jgi:uncharacterized protein YaiL (DUF2058 family)
MVIVQVLAFGRVSDNRVARKTAKTAKIEREKARREICDRGKTDELESKSKMDKLSTEQENTGDTPVTYANGKSNQLLNGNRTTTPMSENVAESDESTADTSETSEEEMMI